jgi:hypothetical protein
MKLKLQAQQRIIYAIESKARHLVKDNTALPPDHPDMRIIRCYASASAREKQAFWEQLIAALEDAPLLTIYAVRA